MIRVSSFNLFIGVYFFYTGFKVKVCNDLFNDKSPVALTGCASGLGGLSSGAGVAASAAFQSCR